jgi:sRNA-binding carbon storage regulator CsrA
LTSTSVSLFARCPHERGFQGVPSARQRSHADASAVAPLHGSHRAAARGPGLSHAPSMDVLGKRVGFEAMLTLSRAINEVLLIGDVIVRVVSFKPRIVIQVEKAGRIVPREFDRPAVGANPTFRVGLSTVMLVGFNRNGELEIGVDAPRTVRIVRGELLE